jgi:fatty acid desaturase
MQTFNPISTPRISEIFSKDEIRYLTERSDLHGWRAVLFTWGCIVLTLVALAYFPNPLMWIIALIVLGGRQLSLAILMHDAAHGTLFKTRWLNEVLADWLCGAPIEVDIKRYRAHHLQHHSQTGTEHDTDRSLIAGMPTTRISLVRKFARDISGITAIKREIGLQLMLMGILKWTVASDVVKLPQEGRSWLDCVRSYVSSAYKTWLVHGAALGLLVATGHAWLYLAWLIAYCTTYSVFIRIRSMAEHACTEPGLNMLRNTRSVRAGFFARATVAPLRVNYHIEHHVMASVPYFRLREMHGMLRERGLVNPMPSYLDVVRIVTSLSGRG